MTDPQYRPPSCSQCGKRVRRWQRHAGFGPIGFTPKTAEIIWHIKCLRSER